MTSKNGFSLIEMSIVLIIIGIISAASISLLGGRIEAARYTTTREKQTAIVEALNRYYAANGSLPCPARGDVALGGAEYGLPIYSTISPPQGCDRTIPANIQAAGTAPTGTTTFQSTNAGAEWIRQGVVPTRILGLSDEMMYDGFDRKFTYVVMEKFTTSSIKGEIKINDGFSPRNVTSEAAFIIISHGKDGKGAYTRGNNIGIQCPSSTAPGLDKENCNNNDIFTETQFNDANIGSTVWFDDVVAWEDKNAVIGLKPSTASGLSIKYTTLKFQGNLGGVAGATAKCVAQYPGYVMCKKSDIDMYGSIGQLPSTTNYSSNVSGWVDGAPLGRNCENWTDAGSKGSSLKISLGGWIVDEGDALIVPCSVAQSIACCQGN